MKTKEKSPELDLFTPIYEIFHELVVLTAQVIWLSVKALYKRFSGSPIELKILQKKNLRVKKRTTQPEALGVDTESKRPVLLQEIDFRRHSFVVGASGWGKTNLLNILQENSLKQNKPIIFFDPKGDIEALMGFKKIVESFNRTCYVFSEHYSDSISLNPILEGTVNQVTDRIMSAYDWSEPFYKDSSQRSLTKVLKKLKSEGTPFSLEVILTELVKIESKENSGIIAKIEAILESDFGKILNADPSGLTLSKIRDERACLYIGLSTQGYSETARAVGKLFLGELLYNSYKSLITPAGSADRTKNPVTIHFDEFGALVTPQFIELLNKCRGAGMEITMAVQSPADLAKVEAELLDQIVENSANLFVLKQRVDTSAAFFSNAIGTTLTSKSTHVTEDGEKQSKGSVREVYELLAHPDIIKNINIGQCILLQQSPTRLRLINIRDLEKSARGRVVNNYKPAEVF